MQADLVGREVYQEHPEFHLIDNSTDFNRKVCPSVCDRQRSHLCLPQLDRVQQLVFSHFGIEASCDAECDTEVEETVGTPQKQRPHLKQAVPG